MAFVSVADFTSNPFDFVSRPFRTESKSHLQVVLLTRAVADQSSIGPIRLFIDDASANHGHEGGDISDGDFFDAKRIGT